MGRARFTLRRRRVVILLLLDHTLIGNRIVVLRNTGSGNRRRATSSHEDILYLMTLLAAPLWGVAQGQAYPRGTSFLRDSPRTHGLVFWSGSATRVGLLCCLYFVWYGYLITIASYKAGSLT
jgi:hypothetical protein